MRGGGSPSVEAAGQSEAGEGGTRRDGGSEAGEAGEGRSRGGTLAEERAETSFEPTLKADVVRGAAARPGALAKLTTSYWRTLEPGTTPRPASPHRRRRAQPTPAPKHTQ